MPKLRLTAAAHPIVQRFHNLLKNTHPIQDSKVDSQLKIRIKANALDPAAAKHNAEPLFLSTNLTLELHFMHNIGRAGIKPKLTEACQRAIINSSLLHQTGLHNSLHGSSFHFSLFLTAAPFPLNLFNSTTRAGSATNTAREGPNAEYHIKIYRHGEEKMKLG